VASRLILFTCGVVGCTTEFEIERNYPTKQGCRNAVRKSFKFWESRWISTSDRLLLSETATARQARLALRGERTSPRLEIPVNGKEEVMGMKSKEIRATIKKKLDSWLKTLPEELREKTKDKIIVTGGAIVSLLTGEEPHDYDVYFRDYETTLAISQHYVKKFKPRKHKGLDVPLYVDGSEGRVRIVAKSAGIASAEGTDKPYEYFEASPGGDDAGEDYVQEILTNPEDVEKVHEEQESVALETKTKGKYLPLFLTSNAITLSDKVQLIIRFFGNPEEIHENYDFIHACNFYQSWDNTLTLKPEALEAILAKELRYVGSKYPVCSLIRTRKFISRGWRINAGQYLKIIMQAAALDLTDFKVIESQLVGLDAAYFANVLDRLKDKDPNKVDGAYLCAIIDELY
jgi:hypothetical protein